MDPENEDDSDELQDLKYKLQKSDSQKNIKATGKDLSRNALEQQKGSSGSATGLGSVAKFKNSKLFQKFMQKKDIIP